MMLLTVSLVSLACAQSPSPFELGITRNSVLQSFGGKVLGDMTVRLAYAMAIHFLFFEQLRKNTDNLPALITMNPVMLTEENGDFVPDTALNTLVEAFIKITIPFYILAIISIGVYLLFVSGSPLGRARAKSSLIKLVISMGVIFLTIPIIQLLLDISNTLAGNVLNLTDTRIGIEVLKSGIGNIEKLYFVTAAFNYWNSLYLLMFSGIIFTSLFMVLAVRYFMVIYFTVLFPVSIMMFAFYFTRRIGAQMFRTTLAWIFIQPIMALILVAISVAAYTMPMLSDGTVELCFALAGYMALIISPLIITKVMDWLAMLMVILTAIEFPGLHGVIGMIDELQIEGPKTEEITPPPPIRPRH